VNLAADQIVNIHFAHANFEKYKVLIKIEHLARMG